MSRKIEDPHKLLDSISLLYVGQRPEDFTNAMHKNIIEKLINANYLTLENGTYMPSSMIEGYNVRWKKSREIIKKDFANYDEAKKWTENALKGLLEGSFWNEIEIVGTEILHEPQYFGDAEEYNRQQMAARVT